LSHHGTLDMGSPVQPMTPEAEIVHWADEASAKATDMLEEMTNPDLFPPEFEGEVSAKRSWRMGRRPWRRPPASDSPVSPARRCRGSSELQYRCTAALAPLHMCPRQP